MNKIIIVCDMGVGGQRGRVFDIGGVIGALSATDYKDPPKILMPNHKNNNKNRKGTETK